MIIYTIIEGSTRVLPHRLNFGDIDMKETDRVTLELLALGLVTFDIRQARCRAAEGNDAVPTGSDAEVMAEGLGSNHPTAAMCAVGMY